ncbi:hypothetical protein SLS58_010028 [Diplodia intermedia]|uniref:Fungal N-terminal domain-containing protein n=1 Tax=Diplodia intermedia TaxID=856260 RepID=A0ABR3T8Q4_9PEZI
MADPFSTAAAAISLVDIAIKSAREIRSLIASIKDAPNALRQVQQTVCEIQRLLEVVRPLVDAYRSSSLPHIDPQSLSSIHFNVRSINEDLTTLRAVTEPIFATDSRSRRLLKSFRFHKRKPMIDEARSRMGYRVALIQGTLSAIGRSNDLFQIGQVRTANDNTQLVIQGQTQLRDDTVGMLHSSAAVSQQLLHQQQTTHVNMLDGNAQIRAAIHSLQPSLLQNIPQILLHEGSASDATATLSTVHRLLPSVLASASLPGTTMDDLGWVEKEVGDTLIGMHLLAVSELRGGLSLTPYGARRTTQPIALQVWNHLRSQSSSVMQRRGTQIRKREVQVQQAEEIELSVRLPEGNLFLWVSDGCVVNSAKFSGSLKGFRVMFTPNQPYNLPGLSASFVESPCNGLRIPSALRTFGLVPDGCAIFDSIWDGDTEEVRDILQRGECAAGDRDEDGDSLLAVTGQPFSRKTEHC